MAGGDCGVSAMVKLALHLEELGAETLSIGRPALGPEDACTLEACGQHLLYVVLLNRAGVSLAAAPADNADPPQILVRVADDANGWQTLCRLCSALERHKIQTLTRPIMAARDDPNGDPDGWIIA